MGWKERVKREKRKERGLINEAGMTEEKEKGGQVAAGKLKEEQEGKGLRQWGRKDG